MSHGEYVIYGINAHVDFDCITLSCSSPLGHTIFGLNSESIIAGCAYTNCPMDFFIVMYCLRQKGTKNWTFYDYSINRLLNKLSIPCDELYLVVPFLICLFLPDGITLIYWNGFMEHAISNSVLSEETMIVLKMSVKLLSCSKIPVKFLFVCLFKVTKDYLKYFECSSEKNLWPTGLWLPISLFSIMPSYLYIYLGFFKLHAKFS